MDFVGKDFQPDLSTRERICLMHAPPTYTCLTIHKELLLIRVYQTITWDDKVLIYRNSFHSFRETSLDKVKEETNKYPRFNHINSPQSLWSSIFI